MTASTLTPDARDAGAGHRLAVRDDCKRLERRLRQAGLLAVEDEPLHVAGELVPAVETPAVGDLAQVQAAAAGVVLVPQRAKRPLDLGHRPAEYLREHQ